MAFLSATCKQGRAHQRGAIFLVVLFLVAATGAGLAAFGRSWQMEAQRQREAALLDAGAAYRRAIGRYFEATPGPLKTYPPDLASLLLDPRFPDARRHLRQPLPDPMSGQTNWVLLPAPGGGIAGVASRSNERPLKRAGFPEVHRGFETLAEQRGERLRYRDWEFIYSPGLAID